MKILIPLAGNGQRFIDAGYKLPKPLIQVHGKSMISHVVSSLNGLVDNAQTIFLYRKDHEKFGIVDHLKSLTNNNVLIPVDKLTDGAACTSLLAKEYINNEEELIIANSDQIIIANIKDTIDKWKRLYADGGIFLFEAQEPKWSFAKCVEDLRVLEVAEKKPISTLATCGVYWYKHGSQYVKHAEQMILDNMRVKNEFYICPVYNNYIENGANIMGSLVYKMHGLGTPEDMNNFIAINSE